jgi:nucleoside-diphosphate-sugar epimerase
VSSPRLAGELLAWRPQVSLVDGLARTLEWLEINAGRFRVDHYVI